MVLVRNSKNLWKRLWPVVDSYSQVVEYQYHMLNVSVVNDEVVVVRRRQCVMYTFHCRITARDVSLECRS